MEQGLYSKKDIEAFLDYMCATAHQQDIFFLWRPQLVDPRDDLVLELAVAAGCRGIVTHNKRHFTGAEKFGISIFLPREFLRLLEEAR